MTSGGFFYPLIQWIQYILSWSTQSLFNMILTIFVLITTIFVWSYLLTPENEEEAKQQ